MANANYVRGPKVSGFWPAIRDSPSVSPSPVMSSAVLCWPAGPPTCNSGLAGTGILQREMFCGLTDDAMEQQCRERERVISAFPRR